MEMPQAKRPYREEETTVESRRRAERFEVLMVPDFFKMLHIRRGMWYESPEEIEAGLEWGRRKARLLRWVRRQMRRRLTSREWKCIHLYFFRGMNYIEVGDATGTNAASAHRAVARSLRKLRVAAKRCRLAQADETLQEEDPA
jgi:DNA-directed RNA polymerase specialized sigma24 family protein